MAELEGLCTEDKSENFMDSGNSSADYESDYEARLYSLVHYSENLEDEVDLPTEKEKFSYHSQRSKVSRLNTVRNIIDTADKLDYLSRSELTSNSEDLKELLRAYKQVQSFCHSTPLQNNCHQYLHSVTNNATRSYENTNVNSNESGVQSLSESFIADESCNFELSSIRHYKSKRVAGSPKSHDLYSKTSSQRKKIDTSSLCNGLELSKLTVNETSDDEHSFSKYDLKLNKSNITCQGTSVKDKSPPDDEHSFSKYDLKLNKINITCRGTSVKDKSPTPKNMSSKKSKMKIPEESVTVISSDSEPESSVFKVNPSAKELPPVIVLSSDEDMTKQESDEDDDIVVVFTGGEQSVIERNEEDSKADIKKKKKRGKKKQKLYLQLNSSHSISASSWTQNMSRFYNESWGGEDFDVDELQQSMSDKRSKWHIMYCDAVPSKTIRYKNRCNNCNTFGHVARYCTQASKPIVCYFCGRLGHLERRCPNPICLRCGNASFKYTESCSKCPSYFSPQPCLKCNLMGHPVSECPEIWRQFHSTTTEEEPINISTAYKPRDQQFCSNCAARGHLFHECVQSSKQGNWLKRPNTSYTDSKKKHTKKRKISFSKEKRAKKRKKGEMRPDNVSNVAEWCIVERANTTSFFLGTYETNVEFSWKANKDESISQDLVMGNSGGICGLLFLMVPTVIWLSLVVNHP